MAEIFGGTGETAAASVEAPQEPQEPQQEAQIEQPQQQVEAPSEEAPQPEQPEPSSREKELQAENERLRRNLQAARRGERQNRSRGSDEVSALRNELRQMQRQQAESLPDDERRQALERITQAERADSTSTVERIRGAVDADIGDLLRERNVSAGDIKGLIEELNPMWNSINSEQSAEMFYRMFTRELDAHLAERKPSQPAPQQSRQEQPPEEPEQPQRNDSRLSMGGLPSGNGGFPRATNDNVHSLWNRWHTEHPGEANPYDQAMRNFMTRGGV